MNIIELISGIFKPAAELIDELHTSEEERLKQRARLMDVQAAAMQRVFDYERTILESQSKIIHAESSSEHWLTATWRPITMLTFLILAVGDALGLLPNPLRNEAWFLLEIGLGGYIVGRSGEKLAKTLTQK